MAAEENGMSATTTLTRSEFEVLTIEDVMRIAHVSQTTALRWVKGMLPDTPRLPAVRIGRQWRVRRSVLMEQLAVV